VDIPRLIKFKFGQLVITPAALEALRESGESPWVFLIRHVAGDWGDLDRHDRERNEQALKDGSRLLSVYSTAKGERIWVITEAEPRNSTCILTPEEY
jgi:hypothetical protein